MSIAPDRLAQPGSGSERTDEQVQGQGGAHRNGQERPRDSQVCITFQIKNGPVDFQVPIHLKVSDYDDTEMIQAARSALHRLFVELGQQTMQWKLSPTELRLLAGMSLRPGP